MQGFRGLLVVGFASMVFACGGSDDDSSSGFGSGVSGGNTDETPVIPVTVAEQPETTNTVITNPTTTVVPETPVIVEEPTTVSTTDFGRTSELFGDATIAWGFTDSEDLFGTTPTFGPDAVTITESGLVIAYDPEAPVIGIVGDETINYQPEAVTCGWIDPVHFCTLAIGNDGETYFMFNPLVNGEATGVQEFCDGPEDCVDGLLENPDGVAAIVVRSTGIAKANGATGDQEAAPYLSYAKQGVPANGVTAATALGLDENEVQALAAKISAILK